MMKKVQLRESERDILKATRDVLRANGYYVIRHQQGLGSHPGMSDLTAVRNCKTIYIECKTLRGQLSKFQYAFANEIKLRGCEYIIVRSADDAVRMFNGK